MTIQVLAVDAADDASLRRWYAVYLPATTAGRLDPPRPTYDDVRGIFLPDSTMRTDAFLACSDGQPVGVGAIQLPQLDNIGLAMFIVAVCPDARHQGVGTALYDEVVRRARAEQRSSLLVALEVPPSDLESAPGVAFAAGRGFTVRNTEPRRVLRLPVPPAKLDALAARAATRASAYGLQTWIGSCPHAYAEEYAHLKSLLSIEAPHGNVEVEQQKWDVDRLREGEERARLQGTTTYTTVAVAPDGTLAGYTEVSVIRHHQGRAFQGDTLVAAAHRGHRLGLAVKVANLRALHAGHPDIAMIRTQNAEQNAPMVAVNTALGFEIVEICQLWQRSL